MMDNTEERLVLALRQLAQARREERRVIAELTEVRAVLEATPEAQAVAATEAKLNDIRNARDVYDREVRLLGQEAFQATGNKKPVACVAMRVQRTVRYEVEEALAWVREHAPTFQELAQRRFVQAVLAGLLPGAPAWVDSDVQTTIAADLSEYEE